MGASSHVAGANVFMRPVEICRAQLLYRAWLYNIYSGVRVTDVQSYIIGASLSEPHIDELNVRNLHMITSDMQGLVWGEPELTGVLA